MENESANNPKDGTSSPTRSISPAKNSAGIRSSIDSDRSNSPAILANGTNGHTTSEDDGNGDPLQKLQRELEKALEEKETLATNYRNLLSKLTNMRNTLGNKLKQDAEELDRREQLIHQLQTQNEDLSSTVDMLKNELVISNADAERASHELDEMRSRITQENANETLVRERELREVQAELERCRVERDEWERTALRDQVLAEEAQISLDTLRRDLEAEKAGRQQDREELETERAKSQNLQSVLEDFQSAKDHELRQAVKDYEGQLLQATQSLAEFKHRALTAELQLEETQSSSSRTQELEKEVKEKTLLIGKLQHEAVILNEHLVEALRRLRRTSSETNVDRRLVTNVLLSFLTTPRTDGKRFEMLSLLSSILGWSDNEREKAGLQRTTNPAGQSAIQAPSFWSRSVSASSAKSVTELDKTDETESFSRLWVEFLLTEATNGSPAASPRRSNVSLPDTPLSPTTKFANTPRRLSSFSSAAMASSPNLTIPSPPSRNGKDSATLHPDS